MTRSRVNLALSDKPHRKGKRSKMITFIHGGRNFSPDSLREKDIPVLNYTIGAV